jgi:quinol-cytochrome oxidoreductase complex cytochrome b subunit
VPAAEGAAALGALAVLLVVLWLVSPYALVLALPAAHAALVATAARRPWHLVALGAVALAPFVALALATAGRLDANPVFAVWYLAETAAAGARGAWGILLGTLIGACVWALGGLVAFRIRKGGLSGGHAAPRRRRPRTRIRLRIDREPRAPGDEPGRW